MATLAEVEAVQARLVSLVERMWPWFVAGGGTSTALNETIDDRVAALAVAGTNMTITYNDGANTLTFDASGGLTDGDKGDITVSGGGTVWNLDLTLAQIDPPAASVDFNGQQATSFRIENRTSDPGSPATGQIWLRTDL